MDMFVFYLISSALVALVGKNRKIGYGWSCLLCLIFTPFIGVVIILFSTKKDKNENSNESEWLKNIRKQDPKLANIWKDYDTTVTQGMINQKRELTKLGIDTSHIDAFMKKYGRQTDEELVAKFCDPLHKLLMDEIRRNEIVQTSTGWPKKETILIILKSRFSTPETDILKGSIEKYKGVRSPKNSWKTAYIDKQTNHILACKE